MDVWEKLDIMFIEQLYHNRSRPLVANTSETSQWNAAVEYLTSIYASLGGDPRFRDVTCTYAKW